MITEDLANYTQQLLSFNPSLIVIGRENADKVDSSRDYIVVDELFSVPTGRSEDFNKDDEEQEFSVLMSGDFTIDFHGDNARANAAKWVVLHRSQKSYELQRDIGITIYHVTSFRDLKSLEGSQYKNRYQIEFKIRYHITETIETLRIDTAQTDIIVDQ